MLSIDGYCSRTNTSKERINGETRDREIGRSQAVGNPCKTMQEPGESRPGFRRNLKMKSQMNRVKMEE